MQTMIKNSKSQLTFHYENKKHIILILGSKKVPLVMDLVVTGNKINWL